MSATWNTVYEGEHEGRTVSVKESNDHTYKVLTTQNFHDEGTAYQDGDRYVHVSPASAGEQVESEVNSRDSLEEALKELHFSTDTVNTILQHLR
jgi:V8-like Glu-specific endopeptidase